MWKHSYAINKSFLKNITEIPIIFDPHSLLYCKKTEKARKTKYRQFCADLIYQLDNLREENPKSYWTLLEPLKQSDKQTEQLLRITRTEWGESFKNLNKKNSNSFP